MLEPGRTAYVHGAPFDAGFLQVGSIHRIHYEQYGNAEGSPVIFLHGGPGGSTSPKSAQSFSPQHYRVILFDQRGCGQSLPRGELRENSTPETIADIEALRIHLGVERWHVFGASWGSTLALLYAQRYRERVVSVVVRGVHFDPVGRHGFRDAWMGTWRVNPGLYEELVSGLGLGSAENGSEGDLWQRWGEMLDVDIMEALATRLLDEDDWATKVKTAKIYDRWAGMMCKIAPPAEEEEEQMSEEDERKMVESCRIDLHYYRHRLWIKEMGFYDKQRLLNLRGIPMVIVNGRYDFVCPANMAWMLHKEVQGSRLEIIESAGHSAGEPGIRSKLLEVCDEFAKLPVN